MLMLLIALQQVPQQNFPEVTHPGSGDAVAPALERFCLPRWSATTTALLREETRLADSVAHHDGAPGLVQLGCLRARLFLTNAFAQESFLMPAGAPWDEGAVRALLHAVMLKPRSTNAAELLSVLALQQYDPAPADGIVAAMRAAVATGSNGPATLRACTEYELRAHNYDAARACALRAIALGSDFTWHLIRLARLAFRAADTVAGSSLFQAAAAAAHDSMARGEVDWQLQWLLTPAEQKELADLPDSVRGIWVRDRMTSRDIRDGQPRRARLAEHFNRLEYVLAHFQLHEPRMLREGFRTLPAADGSYDNDNLFRASCEPGEVSATPFRDYRRWQTDIDDRGVVWMRFGKPDQQADAVPQCSGAAPSTNARAAWAYHLGVATLLLNFEVERFSGSVEPTRLVSGVLGSYFCGIDTERCRLTSKSQAAAFGGGLGVSPEQVSQLHVDDREEIGEATTKDDNSVRGRRNIEVAGRLFRLWDPVTERSISLLTWLAPIKDLRVESDDAGQRTAKLAIELRQWDPTAGAWRDTTLSHGFALPDTTLPRPALAGFVVTPSSPGVSAWSVVASQDSTRWGRSFADGESGLGAGPVALSDLVAASGRHDLVWTLHNLAIPLTPSTSVTRRDTVTLYYQIRSESARGDVRTTISVYRRVNGVTADTASVQEAYPAQPLVRGVNEFMPTLQMAALANGSYRIEIRLTDVHGTVLARRGTILDLE